MFRRRDVKRQGRLARDELSESLEHLRMAAAHVASGAAQALAPGLGSAKKAASEGVDSLVEAARDSARSAGAAARKGKAKVMKTEPAKARRRWPKIASGMLVAGAAAGATGALMSRRRNRQDPWHEYGTSRSQPGIGDESTNRVTTDTTTARETGDIGQYGQTTGMASKNSRP